MDVVRIFDDKFCIKLNYKGYEISISQAAYEVAVYSSATSSNQLFSVIGNDGQQVHEAMEFINTLPVKG